MNGVTLQSFGACRTVTGSRHLIDTGRLKVLLDCGMFQGKRRESRERNRHVQVRPDVVVLSHAHVDHSGALPTLVKDGYRGPIHATAATADLCQAMLLDSARLSESDAKFVNKHRKRRGERAIEPIYTVRDAKRALRLFVPHGYGETFELGGGVRARFQDAGHIIGSAGVLLQIDDGPSVYFTGDIGRRVYPILEDPAPIPDADVVLSECTYGTRDHPPTEIAQETFRNEVRRCIETKGKLLIPAFSVGRTQNLVYTLAQDWQAGRLPRCPVFVDSPLAEKATDVYINHPECFDDITYDFLREGGRPFFPRGVEYVGTSAESKALNGRQGPFIVIAGSGMCEGGRIVHHLKQCVGDPGNTVMIVGWCAPDTLGRRIAEEQPRIRIHGRWYDLNARVARINAYSAHAGRSDLIEFLSPTKQMGAAIYLVHGDEDTAMAFADTLRDEGHGNVVIPETYARYPLTLRAGNPQATGF